MNTIYSVFDCLATACGCVRAAEECWLRATAPEIMGKGSLYAQKGVAEGSSASAKKFGSLARLCLNCVRNCRIRIWRRRNYGLTVGCGLSCCFARLQDNRQSLDVGGNCVGKCVLEWLFELLQIARIVVSIDCM